MPEDAAKPQGGAMAPCRLDLMKARGVAIDMPRLAAGRYLIDYLYEFGPVMPAGMGSGPVTFSEMEAWERKAGIELAPWEARLLRRLSGDYLAESHRATKPNCPPPFEDSAALNASIERDQSRRLDTFFGG